MSEYHLPVMLQECIDGLNINPEGIYVDVTFGGGGHSRAILEKLKGGKLVAFDQDMDAQSNIPKDERFIFFAHNFKHLQRFLRVEEIGPIDGIIADLGVSSHHFDDPDRGFSFRFNAPLDMRMDQSRALTALDILHGYSEKQLADLFFQYGELRNARKLAGRLVEWRKQTPLKTTADFKAFLEHVEPSGNVQYLAKAFQAIRIEVNGEMDVLTSFLEQSAEVLSVGGRLVVLSFHSLEDRLVKNFIRSGAVDGEVERDIFGNFSKPFKAVNKKLILASEAEQKNNSRSRSAKLRIAERI